MAGKGSKRRRGKARAEKFRAKSKPAATGPRELTADEVTFTVYAEFDDVPVRGNAMYSGDDAEDEKYEDYVLDRMRRGDVWAWASVEVRASWGDFSGSGFLGCCTYEDEEDFKRESGYYEQLQQEALADLNASVRAAYGRIKPLVDK